jgi:hypothetical protein
MTALFATSFWAERREFLELSEGNRSDIIID